jgi:hypothetical protein
MGPGTRLGDKGTCGERKSRLPGGLSRIPATFVSFNHSCVIGKAAMPALNLANHFNLKKRAGPKTPVREKLGRPPWPPEPGRGANHFMTIGPADYCRRDRLNGRARRIFGGPPKARKDKLSPRPAALLKAGNQRRKNWGRGKPTDIGLAYGGPGSILARGDPPPRGLSGPSLCVLPTQLMKPRNHLSERFVPSQSLFACVFFGLTTCGEICANLAQAFE